MVISAQHVDLRTAGPAASVVAAPPPSARSVLPAEVAWRELSRGLWVGRTGDTHVGIIEQGRRFTLTDAQDHPHGGFETLDAAKTATGAIDIVPAAAVEEVSSAGCIRTDPLTSALLVTGALGTMAGIIGVAFELLLVR